MCRVFVKAMFGLLVVFVLKGLGRVSTIQALFDKCRNSQNCNPKSNQLVIFKVVLVNFFFASKIYPNKGVRRFITILTCVISGVCPVILQIIVDMKPLMNGILFTKLM